MKNEPRDYRHIKAWGRLLGSDAPYVERQQQKAADEQAPIDATFQRYGSTSWATVQDIKDKGRRDYVIAWAAGLYPE